MSLATAHAPLAAPQLERIADCHVELGPALDVGETPVGRRRLIPIVTGRLEGRLSGTVLPGGADFQLVVTPELVQLHARYVVRTDQGELVYIENEGVRSAAPEVIDQLNRGTPVAPELVYCRTRPRFETASARLSWLMTSTFVGTAERAPDFVRLAFFRVV